MKHLLLSLSAAALCSAAASAQTCLETTFVSNNGGATGWANYMDVTVLNPTTVVSLEANFNVAAGSPVNLEVWTRTGTYDGFEQDPIHGVSMVYTLADAKAAGTRMTWRKTKPGGVIT